MTLLGNIPTRLYKEHIYKWNGEPKNEKLKYDPNKRNNALILHKTHLISPFSDPVIILSSSSYDYKILLHHVRMVQKANGAEIIMLRYPLTFNIVSIEFGERSMNRSLEIEAINKNISTRLQEVESEILDKENI